jgi:hypothetical protein
MADAAQFIYCFERGRICLRSEVLFWNLCFMLFDLVCWPVFTEFSLSFKPYMKEESEDIAESLWILRFLIDVSLQCSFSVILHFKSC